LSYHCYEGISFIKISISSLIYLKIAGDSAFLIVGAVKSVAGSTASQLEYSGGKSQLYI
jgi:hypothetical protein